MVLNTDTLGNDLVTTHIFQFYRVLTKSLPSVSVLSTLSFSFIG
jgi:hypothetical protein